MQEITIAMPQVSEYNMKILKNTRAAVLRLAAEYRRMGEMQSQAMAKAWKEIQQIQQQTIQSLIAGTQQASGQFGGLGQVLEGLLQKLKNFGIAIAQLFGFDKNGSMKKLADTTSAAAKSQTQLAKSTKSAAKELAKTVLGIDELNIAQEETSASTSGSGGSSGSGSEGNKDDVEPDTSQWVSVFDTIKSFLEQMDKLFRPTIVAWKDAFWRLGQTAQVAWERIKNSALDLWNNALQPLGEYVMMDFIPSIVNGFSKMLAPIVTDLGRVFMQDFALNFQLACFLVGDVINSYLKPMLQLLQQMFLDMFQGITDSWKVHGEALVEHLTLAGENVRNLVLTIYYDVIKPVLDELMQQLTILWDEHLKPLWDQIALLFASLGDMCVTLWNEFVFPLLQQFMKEFGPILSDVLTWVVRRFSDSIAIIADAVTAVTKILYGLTEFVTGAFTGNWNRAWKSIEKAFGDIWDSMRNIAYTAVNGIIDTINTMIRVAYAAVNSLIDKMNSISFTVPDWIPGIGGSHFGFNMPHLDDPSQIPKLAQGAVLPANKPFLAMVGDQKRGTNVEAPLETIQQALAAVLAQTGSGGNVVNQPIVLKLDSQVLYRAMVKVEQNQGVKIGGAFAHAY